MIENFACGSIFVFKGLWRNVFRYLYWTLLAIFNIFFLSFCWAILWDIIFNLWTFIIFLGLNWRCYTFYYDIIQRLFVFFSLCRDLRKKMDKITLITMYIFYTISLFVSINSSKWQGKLLWCNNFCEHIIENSTIATSLLMHT